MIGDLAGFRAYHTDRGNAVPAAAIDSDATSALVRGSDVVRRMFVLTADETDPRVIDAAYTAAGYELTADGLLPMPGFWAAPETGKVLTKAGEVSWTLTGNASASDAMTPRDALASILRGAIVPVSLGVGMYVV